MKALIIVDMQAGSFSPNTMRYDDEGIISRINTLSRHFRAVNDRVIFIRHDGTRENFLIHGTPDWEILKTMDREQTDIIFEKTANDAFYRTGLESFLQEHEINDLYITGCATDFCVNATVHSALVKDFNVTVVMDCHTTADRPGIKAEEIIRFHNWLWGNLTPTGGKIRISPMSDVIGLPKPDAMTD
jgi:nicotinamidase-related amidase